MKPPTLVSKWSPTASALVARLLFAVAVIWIWIVGVPANLPSTIIPPFEQLSAFASAWVASTFWSDVASTLFRVIIGLGLATFAGVALGVVTTRRGILPRLLVDLLNFLRPITPVALAPLFILWFGLNEGMRIGLVAWGSSFPIWIATMTGIREIKSVHLRVAQMLSYSPPERLWHLYLPSALPFVMSGVRTSLGISLILSYVSEMTGADSGVGYRLYIGYSNFQIADMLVCLATFGLLGWILDRVIAITSSRLLGWSRHGG